MVEDGKTETRRRQKNQNLKEMLSIEKTTDHRLPIDFVAEP